MGVVRLSVARPIWRCGAPFYGFGPIKKGEEIKIEFEMSV
jgi:hypothetical protein